MTVTERLTPYVLILLLALAFAVALFSVSGSVRTSPQPTRAAEAWGSSPTIDPSWGT